MNVFETALKKTLYCRCLSYVLELVSFTLRQTLFIGISLFLLALAKDAFVFYCLGPLFPRACVWKPLRAHGHRRRFWAVITGADGGIGRYYALELARRGFDICIVNREPSVGRPLDKELKEIGIEVKRIVYNFSEKSADKKAEQKTHLTNQLSPLLPDIHMLINNVGTMGGTSYDDVMRPLFGPRTNDMSVLDIAQDLVRVNQSSVLLMTSLIVPSMIERRSGVLINVSSLCGYEGMWGSTVYCATKAFVLVLTEGLRQELAPFGIVVQAVTPSFVDTKLLSPSLRRNLPSCISVQPEQVAQGSLNTLGWQAVTHGCFAHAVQNRFLRLTSFLCPTWLHDAVLRFMTKTLGDLTRGKQKAV